MSHNPHRAPTPGRSTVPATVAELEARLEARGLGLDWFRRNTPPMTPEQLQREIDALCSADDDLPALPNVPECSTFYPHTKSAKRTQVPIWHTPAAATTTATTTNPIPPSADLTPRQEHAVRLLVAGHSASAAARLLGVERHTLHRWKKLPAFQRQLQRLLEAL